MIQLTPEHRRYLEAAMPAAPKTLQIETASLRFSALSWGETPRRSDTSGGGGWFTISSNSAARTLIVCGG